MKAEKIIRSLPLARRILQAESIKFDAVSANGFFLTVMGNNVLEFDTLKEAKDASDSLNKSIDGIKKSYLAAYEQKIEAILNA